MRRRLSLRRFMPRSAGQAQGPLWPRPLAMIFRAYREAPPTPAPNWRGADGERVTLAPRLQFALHFWTLHTTQQHCHEETHLHSGPSATVADRQRTGSPKLHFHHNDQRGRDQSSEPGPRRVDVGQPIDARLARAGSAAARMVLRSPQAAIDRLANPSPGPFHDEPAATGPRRASAVPAPVSELSFARAFAPRASAVRRSPPGSAGHLPRRAGTRAGVQATMAHRLPSLVGFSTSPCASGTLRDPRRESPTAAPRPSKSFTPAPLEFAARPGQRGSQAVDSVNAAYARRTVQAPELDYRRPAAPPIASQAAPLPRPAPPPAPPAIDLDALSREVIERIEKRMRIERERHGRI